VHAGWPFVTQMLGIAFRRANIYVCADLYMLGLPGWRDYVDAANLYLEDRFLFGTAYPFNGLQEYADKFVDLPFRREILGKLMYDNSAALFLRS
jgi:predicted TIM-barrel fold metal-dependent hydrolase